MIERKTIKPTYKRESGLFVLNFVDIPFPEGFEPKEKSVVYIPPLQIGGNHKHPRVEVIIGLGDLELMWQDEMGILKKEEMETDDGKLKMFIVNSMTPHTVKNRSKESFGILIEFASEEQYDVEKIQLI